MTKKLTIGSIIRRMTFIGIGAFIMGVGLEGVLLPNLLIDGGITGIAMLISRITGLKLGLLLCILNVPFFVLGYKKIGKVFAFSMMYGIAVLSLSTACLKHINPIVGDGLLAVAFGGILLGLGVGIVMRNGGVLDGTETLSILLEKRLPLSVGEIILIINVVIFSVASLVFGLNNALYSMLTYYIASKTIDTVVKGFDDKKMAYIISDKGSEIAKEIEEQLRRGVTFLNGEGSYSGEPKKVLMCVFARLEESQIKDIVREIDIEAFTIISSIEDVHGGRFKKRKMH